MKGEKLPHPPSAGPGIQRLQAWFSTRERAPLGDLKRWRIFWHTSTFDPKSSNSLQRYKKSQNNLDLGITFKDSSISNLGLFLGAYWGYKKILHNNSESTKIDQQSTHFKWITNFWKTLYLFSSIYCGSEGFLTFICTVAKSNSIMFWPTFETLKGQKISKACILAPNSSRKN